MIYGQCNKSRHSKERCHWNPDNPDNKLKDKKEAVVNGVLAQLGGTGTKSNNKGGRKEAKKFGSIIYRYFIYNSIEQKNYGCFYKDATYAMFKEKAAMATPKKDNVVVNMVLAINTHK